MRGRHIVEFLMLLPWICLLVFCLCKLGDAIKNRISELPGLGWEESEEEVTDRLAECCEELEKYLASGKESQDSGLLWLRVGEGGVDDALERLEGVDETALSDEEWLLYRKLLYCRDMRRAEKELPDYEALLSEFSGTLQRIREECYVSCFSEKADILDYLEWLGEIPTAVEELQGRLKTQQGLAGFYAQETISGNLLLCGELEGEEGLLDRAFQEKLSGCVFLTEEEKESLRLEENGRMEEVTVSLKELEEYLGKMEGGSYGGGLCSYPEGAAYYDYLLECNTGSGMKATEMYWYLDTARKEIWQAKEAMAMDSGDMIPGEWTELLDQLYRHTEAAFSGIGEINWEVFKLPDTFFGRISKALYRKKGEENYIYVSDSLSGEDALTVYQVLAHEGFPGHAYSSNVERQILRPVVDDTLVFPGYMEGWAVWAEFASADWLAEGQEEYREMLYRNLHDEIVLSQMDIGIHGLNWSMEDLEAFAETVYGKGGRAAASALWNMLADNPGIYQSYTVGYLKLKGLEEWCRERGMGKKEFVSLYQQCGQAPFTLAEEWIQRRVRDE